MPTITTQTQIAASPGLVRDKFLDFSEIPKYHRDGFIASIASATNKAPSDLTKGDRLKCVVGRGSLKVKPSVLENSQQVFRWGGGLRGIIKADHAFRFEPIDFDGTTTLFIHEEKFSGILSVVMGENWFARWIGWRRRTKMGFEEYNRDFKRWVENPDGEAAKAGDMVL